MPVQAPRNNELRDSLVCNLMVWRERERERERERGRGRGREGGRERGEWWGEEGDKVCDHMLV